MLCRLYRRHPDLRRFSKFHSSHPLRAYCSSPAMSQPINSLNGTITPPPEQFKPTASHDFRSDTLTSPTKAMLDAIYRTTYRDDGYAEDETTNALESSIAALTGKPAGLLVMSGVMGNQVAMRTHLTTPPHSVLCDARSHIANHEAGGLSSISGGWPICVTPSNGHHLTLEDVKAHAILSDNVHYCPTTLVCLENTCGGMIMPLSEMKRIREWASEQGIKVHLDGARLWEAAASGAADLEEFCSMVDSASMCFSKGLGAPLGSVVVGEEGFIRQARRVRKMLGGGGRQSGLISAAATIAVEHGFGSGPKGEGGHLKACHERARTVARGWTSRGGKLANPVETNMVWLDLPGSGVDGDEFVKKAEAEGIVANGGRIVCHYQLAEDAYSALDRVMEALLASKSS